MFRTGAQFMILVLLAGLALMRESRHEPLASWDNAFADFLAMNSRHGAKPAPMTLVGINDSRLAKPSVALEPARFLALFPVRAAAQAGSRGASIRCSIGNARSILPEDQNRKLPQYEKILRDNILRAPKMLLGSRLGIPDDPQVIPPLQEVPLLRNVHGQSGRDSGVHRSIEQQPAETFRLSSTVGFTNLPPTHERYNSVPLLFRYRGQVTPAFTLQAVMLWAQLTPDEVDRRTRLAHRPGQKTPHPDRCLGPHARGFRLAARDCRLR